MRPIRSLCLAAASLAIGSAPAPAVDGDLDDSFDFDGKLTFHFDLGQDYVDEGVSVTQDPAGRIVLGGYVQRSTEGDTDFGFGRFGNDGALDTGFGNSGRTILYFDLGGIGATDIRADRLGEVVAMADGRVVSCGTAEYETPGGSANRLVLARLDADGLADTTFGPDSNGRVVLAPFGHEDSHNPTCTSMVVHDDGRIVVPFTNELQYQTGLIRLEEDGDPDPTFGGDGISELPACSTASDACQLTQVVRLVSGKYMALGRKRVAGETRLFVARYTSGGLLDTSFSGDGQSTLDNPNSAVSFETAVDAALDPQGRVVVLENVTVPGGNDDYLVRLDFNGGADASFGNSGWLQVELRNPPAAAQVAHGLIVQGDGKLLVSGAHEVNELDWDCDAMRLLPNASGLDPDFGSSGRRSIAFDLGSGGNLFDTCHETSAADGRPVLVGTVRVGEDDEFAAVRLTNSYIFVDGFATASTFFWSNRVP